MQVFSGRVRDGAIVPEDGVTLREGAMVTVIADGDDQGFEATAEEESELLEAIAGGERGEIVRAAQRWTEDFRKRRTRDAGEAE